MRAAAPNSRQAAKERRQRIAELLRAGLTYQAICQRLGCHSSTVSQVVKDLKEGRDP